MTNSSPGFHITERDFEVLTALDALPLTADQLLTFSRTFHQPFSHLRIVQRRLQILSGGGLLTNFPYAVASEGRSPHYYKLTRVGYRMLHGFDAVLPKRRYFERIAENRHFHTRSLVDFIVTLADRCQRRDIVLQHLARENTVAFETDAGKLFPDAAFQLRVTGHRSFNFVVELDNGSERVRSNKDAESIERKIRGYDQHQSTFEAFSPDRYVVLFVTTRSRDRLDHMLQTAWSLTSNRQRRVFLGVCLDDFLQRDHASQEALSFFGIDGKPRTLVDLPRPTQTPRSFMTKRAVMC